MISGLHPKIPLLLAVLIDSNLILLAILLSFLVFFEQVLSMGIVHLAVVGYFFLLSLPLLDDLLVVLGSEFGLSINFRFKKCGGSGHVDAWECTN